MAVDFASFDLTMSNFNRRTSIVELRSSFAVYENPVPLEVHGRASDRLLPAGYDCVIGSAANVDAAQQIHVCVKE